MTTIDGLLALVDGVQDFLTAQSWDVRVTFGWKERVKILNQGPGGASRVVFMPGRMPPEGTAVPRPVDAGAFTKPRIKEDNPRPLVWWHKVVTVSIWGVDTTRLNDERAQYAAAVDLVEATTQAIHRAVYTTPDGVEHNVGLADVIWESAQWIQPPTENAFGREFFAYFTHNGPLYDIPVGTATPKPSVVRFDQ